MSLEEQNTVPLSTLFNVVDTELSFGNRCFNQSRFEDAKDRYKQAYLELFDYEKAQDYLTMAQANKPFDIDINNLLRKLAVCYKDYLDKEKELCFKMCADFVKK
uniref:Uncharacterized protein n=1 Tax=Hucho hucho TaxID=62062 RepID=A0A4W5M0W7_9TELE